MAVFTAIGIAVGASVAAAFTVGVIVAIVVVAVAVLVISMVMQPGGFDPSTPNPGNNPDQGVKQRIPTDPRNKMNVVYGFRKQTGQITMADIKSNDQTMYFIISVCEGPVQSCEDVYWADKKISFSGNINTGLRNVNSAVASNGSGAPTDFLNGHLRMRFYPAGGRCSHMESNSARWRAGKANRRMTDTAYMYLELDYDREDRVTGLENSLFFYIKGRKIRAINNDSPESYLAGTPRYSTNPAECLLDYMTDTSYGCSVGIDDIDVASFYRHKRFCGEQVSYLTAPKTTVETVVGIESTRFGHSFSGAAGKFTTAPRNKPQSYNFSLRRSVTIPNAELINVGDVLSTSPDGTNPATVTAVSEFGQVTVTPSSFTSGFVGVGSGTLSPHFYRVNSQVVTTNVASFTKTRDKYTTNGSMSTSGDLDKNIMDLTSGNSAWFTYNLGRFGVISDTTAEKLVRETYNGNNADDGITSGSKYVITEVGVTPTDWNSFGSTEILPSVGDVFTATRSSVSGDVLNEGRAVEIAEVFSEENMFGGISISSTGFENLLNKVTAKWASIEQVTQEEDQLVVELDNDAAFKNKNEPLLETTISYTMVNNPVEAKRLAVLALNHSRQYLTVDFVTSIAYTHLQVGDVIGVRHTTPLWGYEGENFDIQNPVETTPKLFRILHTEESNEGETLSLNISALEYANETYADLQVQDKDAAPNTNFLTSSRAPNIGTISLDAKIAEYHLSENLIPFGGVDSIMTFTVYRADGAQETFLVTIVAGATAAQVAEVVSASINASGIDSVLSSQVKPDANETIEVLFKEDPDVGDATLSLTDSVATQITLEDGEITSPFGFSNVYLEGLSRVADGIEASGFTAYWLDNDPFLDKVELRWYKSGDDTLDLDSLTVEEQAKLGTASSSSPPPFEVVGLDYDSTYQAEIRSVSHLGITGEWLRMSIRTPIAVSPSVMGNFTALEEIYETNVAAGVKSRMVLTWDKAIAVEGIPSSVFFQVDYKLDGEDFFVSAGNSSDTLFYINDLLLGRYTFRVTGVSPSGLESSPSTYVNTVEGLTGLPENVSNLRINPSASTANITWDKSTSLDVLSGGSVQIRYTSNDLSIAAWNTSQVIVEALSGVTTSKSVPLLVGTYLIKFVDSGGRESAVATVVSNNFIPAGFNFVIDNEQANLNLSDTDPVGFAGTKEDFLVDIRQTEETNQLETEVGYANSKYFFEKTVDLGSEVSARLTPDSFGTITKRGDDVCNIVDVCALTSFETAEQPGKITFYERNLTQRFLNPTTCVAAGYTWDSSAGECSSTDPYIRKRETITIGNNSSGISLILSVCPNDRRVKDIFVNRMNNLCFVDDVCGISDFCDVSSDIDATLLTGIEIATLLELELGSGSHSDYIYSVSRVDNILDVTYTLDADDASIIIKPVENTDTAILTTALNTQRAYEITLVGTTDFTTIGATSNTVGEIFIATGRGAGTGTVKEAVNTVDATVGLSATVGSLVIGNEYVINNLGDTDFLLIGAEQNVAGEVFIATSVGSGTGTVSGVNTIVRAPDWSKYKELIAGDYRSRAFQFRTDADTSDRNTLVQIDRLNVKLDTPDILYTGFSKNAAIYNYVEDGDFTIGEVYNIFDLGSPDMTKWDVVGASHDNTLVIGNTYGIDVVTSTDWTLYGGPLVATRGSTFKATAAADSATLSALGTVYAKGHTFTATAAAGGDGGDGVATTLVDYPTGGIVLGAEYEITSPGDTDWTLVGSLDNLAGTVFVATGTPSGTGIANSTGLLQVTYPNSGFFSGVPIRPDTIKSGGTYTIITIGNAFDPSDFTLIGAGDNNPGTTFVATGPTTGSGSVSDSDSRLLPRVVSNVISGQEGDSMIITDRSVTGFRATILNNGRTVSRSIDWSAIGS